MKGYIEHKGIIAHITYIFVFCTRYRRKIFSIPGIRERFVSLTGEACSGIKADILDIKCEGEHVYIEVSAQPGSSPNVIVRTIKAHTSSALRSESKELSAMTSLWTRAYMVSTDEINETDIESFVSRQKKHP